MRVKYIFLLVLVATCFASTIGQPNDHEGLLKPSRKTKRFIPAQVLTFIGEAKRVAQNCSKDLKNTFKKLITPSTMIVTIKNIVCSVIINGGFHIKCIGGKGFMIRIPVVDFLSNIKFEHCKKMDTNEDVDKSEVRSLLEKHKDEDVEIMDGAPVKFVKHEDEQDEFVTYELGVNNVSNGCAISPVLINIVFALLLSFYVSKPLSKSFTNEM